MVRFCMLLLVISGFINGESHPSNEGHLLQKVLPEPRGVCASCPPTGKYCIGKNSSTVQYSTVQYSTVRSSISKLFQLEDV